jgi:hypothetical protein
LDIFEEALDSAEVQRVLECLQAIVVKFLEGAGSDRIQQARARGLFARYSALREHFDKDFARQILLAEASRPIRIPEIRLPSSSKD